MGTSLRERAKSALPWTAVLTLSVAFRLPPLLNAAATHSDSAVVGLQAMHLLRGEWSPFLLGSGYQTSVDSVVAAAFFLVLGPTPFALRLSSFALHLVLTCFVHATLRRRVAPWTAALLVAPLIFTACPSNTYILFAPRQASLTLVAAVFWLLDGASAAPRPLARFAGGGALALLACFADPYAQLFLPALGLFAALAALDGSRAKDARALAARRMGACAAGAVLGAVPLVLLHLDPRFSSGPQRLETSRVAHNAALLWDTCLPWALSYEVFFAQRGLEYLPWAPPRVFASLQRFAAFALVAGLLAGGAAVLVGRRGWGVRPRGPAGALMLPVTLGAFLVSVMVMDLYSARYLAAIVLMAPFALLPVASRLGARRFGVAIAPYLVSAAVAGWLSYAPATDGIRIRTEPGAVADERRLEEVLTARGVRYVMGDYWTSYRLTFLFGERVIVVPENPAEDRYPPHRRAFTAAANVAYIYDPLRSRESLEGRREAFRRGVARFSPSADEVAVGRFTVVFLQRPARARGAAGPPGGPS